MALKLGPRLNKAEDSCRQGKALAQKQITRYRQLVVLAFCLDGNCLRLCSTVALTSKPSVRHRLPTCCFSIRSLSVPELRAPMRRARRTKERKPRTSCCSCALPCRQPSSILLSRGTDFRFKCSPPAANLLLLASRFNSVEAPRHDAPCAATD